MSDPHILNTEQEEDSCISADTLSYHFLDDIPQGATLYILCDEVELLVLVEDSNELEHIGVIQAA